jgi:hypothetical protein
VPTRMDRDQNTLEANKEVVRRWWHAVDTHDVSVIDELFSPDFVNHSVLVGDPPGIEGIRNAFEQAAPLL